MQEFFLCFLKEHISFDAWLCPMGRHKSSSIWAVRASASLLGLCWKDAGKEDWATIVTHPKAYPNVPLCSPPQSWFSLFNDDHLMRGFYRNSENSTEQARQENGKFRLDSSVNG